MWRRMDPSARKALSLEKDVVFRLLVLMMIMLGWLAGMGAAGLLGLQQVYQQWQLTQKSHVSVYLMPDSPPQQIVVLREALQQLPGVGEIQLLDQDSTRSLVQPYLGENSPLPLPKILDVRVDSPFDRTVFDSRVKEIFPLAEVDDARGMLQAVSKGVRFVQSVAVGVGLVVFIVLALLVVLTVRAGLRAKRSAMAVLQYIGATDGFMTTLVTRQVLWRGVAGALGAALLGMLTLLLLQHFQAGLAPYMTVQVWCGTAAVPVLLLGVVYLSAQVVARHTLQELGRTDG